MNPDDKASHLRGGGYLNGVYGTRSAHTAGIQSVTIGSPYAGFRICLQVHQRDTKERHHASDPSTASPE